MLSSSELKRYDRQIRLIGVAGQSKLKSSTVFVAGAGGLGSPISIYLAAAGVGKIIIVDKDRVELSNLNRQILHGTKDVGRAKVESAKETLCRINDEIEVVSICEEIRADNVLDLIDGCDLIADAMDNYGIRYLLNSAAISKRVPLVHGAINGLFGQATTIIPYQSPCLRCVFPRPPPESVFPAIGVTPGIIGMIEASEAIKYLTNIGELLAGRLFIWDGESCQAETIQIERNASCPDCGP